MMRYRAPFGARRATHEPPRDVDHAPPTNMSRFQGARGVPSPSRARRVRLSERAGVGSLIGAARPPSGPSQNSTSGTRKNARRSPTALPGCAYRDTILFSPLGCARPSREQSPSLNNCGISLVTILNADIVAKTTNPPVNCHDISGLMRFASNLRLRMGQVCKKPSFAMA